VRKEKTAVLTGPTSREKGGDIWIEMGVDLETHTTRRLAQNEKLRRRGERCPSYWMVFPAAGQVIIKKLTPGGGKLFEEKKLRRRLNGRRESREWVRTGLSELDHLKRGNTRGRFSNNKGKTRGQL